MRHSTKLLVVGILILLSMGSLTAWAQAPVLMGEVRPYRVETPHPYPAGSDSRAVVWTDTVICPGASFVRVHFNGLSLAPGDYVTVSDPGRSQAWTYTGRGPHGDGDVWAFAVSGDTAVVQVHGGRGVGHGYLIDAVGHGTKTSDPSSELICGSDGREDVACHLPEIDAAQRPVARLLFISGRFVLACTGWLISGSNDSTLVTNYHCIRKKSEVRSLQATFNLQHTTCGGSTMAATSNYAGGDLLRSSSLNQQGPKGGLDYSLMTLQGNPELTWGELIPSTKSVSINDLIWFIQHAGGGLKTVGFWEDAAQTARCAVDTVSETYGRSFPGSQTGYACDSEGGASGSPIVDPGSGHAVALHHFGLTGSNPCLNAGTAMSAICADAGSLLNCVSD